MGQHCVTQLVKFNIIILYLIFRIGTATAQVTDDTFEYEIQGESIEENEEFLYLFKSKISFKEFLNNANIYTLFITENQHQALFEHIQTNGQLLDLLELQTVNNFSIEDYYKLKKIIFIDPLEYFDTKKSIKINCINFYQSDVDKKYLGGKWGNYQQIKITEKKGINIGVSREVDVGENPNELLGDHSSFYINKKNSKKEFTIGEYQVYHGFGLLVGQGYSLSFGNGGINNLVQNKWIGNASRTEINTMNGTFIKYNQKRLSYALGLSIKKIDSGTPTGYHRTLTEISKKNTINEKLILSSIEYQTNRYKYNVLGIYNIENNSGGYSFGFQNYFRNTISFIEYSLYQRLHAYTIGMVILIAKDIQLNLSHTHFTNNYKTPWQSYTTQGFSENDGDGYIINIGFPLRKKWIISYSTKINAKDYFDEKKVGREFKTSQALLINKNLSNSTKFSISLLAQNNNFISSSIRTKTCLQSNLTEDTKQEYEFLLNTNKIEYSKALAYNLKMNRRHFKYQYTIAYFQIKNNLPIYYTLDNSVQTRQTIGVYNSDVVQNFGVSIKVKRKINIGFNLQFISNSTDLNSKFKLTFSIHYL